MDPKSAATLLSGPRSPSGDEPAPHDALDAAELSRGAAPAVRDAIGRWTYRQLAEDSRRRAERLRAAGVGPGDRVVVRAFMDRRVVSTLYACSRLGATFVPLALDATETQLADIVEDCRPALVLADDGALARDPRPGEAEPQDPGAGAGPALLIYTSGSTARPKAVVCPPGQVVFAAAAVARRLRYRADDVVLCRLPLSFDYGLYQIFLTALAGAELVLADPRADAGLIATVHRCGVTVAPIVPSLATLLLRLVDRDRRPTSIRLFTNTGERLPEAVIEALRDRFPNAGIQLMFGITECKRISILEVDDDLRRPGSVGRPLDGTTVRVTDPSGATVPPGVVGEVVVAGPHVMAGYWNAPELTRRVFRQDPATGETWLHTGDYGHQDDDGHLYFHGRRDDMLKLNGVRTSVAEIEAAAYAVPIVTDAGLVPGSAGRAAVLCAVASGTPAEVLRGLRERLGPQKTPRACVIVERIPRGATGKVDRVALRRLVEESSGVQQAVQPSVIS